jgi:hypothetical protein
LEGRIMSDLNRRGAMLAMASGAATAGTLMATTTGEASMQETTYEKNKDTTDKKTKDALEKAIKDVKAVAGPFPATVGLARSWDPHVYLVLDNGVKGYASLDLRGHGIASACQASNRKVFMRYDSNDPNWGDGAGFFQGVQVALDRGSFV